MPKLAVDPKSTTAKVGDSAKKTARTGVQGAIAVTVLVQGWNLFAPHPLTPEQTGWATVALTSLVTFAMNLLEENGMPALLKGQDDDLVQREIQSLAAAIGDQHNAIERLENALFDRRADARRPESTDRPFFTDEVERAAWPPGGLG